MTNYIEEMMRTAGMKGCSKELLFIGDSPYPLFLGRQQLEIIKLIGKVKDFNCFFDKDDDKWFFSAGLTLPVCFDFQESNQDFTQALAQLTTELMKAGELDKEKVKEILEG